MDSTPQNLASDPNCSCWVSASAGSGKTKILIDRFVRLLLSGAEFDSILCLTYTNAAASEIKIRLRDILWELSHLSKTERTQKLKALLGTLPTDETLQRAFRLYDEFLCKISTLKIQTLHRFCKEVLTALPFEAKIYGPIQVLEENKAQALLKDLLENSLLNEKNEDFFKNFCVLSRFFSVSQIDERFAAIASKRYEFAQFLKKDSPTYLNRLQEWLKIKTDSEPFDESKLIAAAFQIKNKAQSTSDTQTLQQSLDHHYREAFLTQAQTLKKRILTTAILQKEPEACATFLRQADLFYQRFLQTKTTDFIEKTHTFAKLVEFVLEQYQRKKEEIGQYDFEDLIMKTNELFTRAQEAPSIRAAIWAQFPVQHLLLDEAQDTSPQQWQLILQWVNTFFETSSPRTLFIVGDIKQSIYSFQGAQPWLFHALESVFQKTIESMGGTWRKIVLQTAFRTTQTVLNIVDTIFQTDDTGVSFDHSYGPHISARETPGFVRVINVENDGKNDKNTCIATAVTSYIADLLKEKVFLPSTQASVQPNDILILTRRRTDLIPLITAQLQTADILVAAPDKTGFSSYLVWLDLLAFMRFLVFPRDDYNLACLLKSPFGNATEDELFELCSNRTSFLFDYLWQSKTPLAQKFKAILLPYYEEEKNLKFCSEMYDFFHRVLAQVTPNFRPLYGPPFLVVFDAFLEELHQFFKENPLNLLHALTGFESKILSTKNSASSNGVHFMTVHGSKGLQAPIVILADTSDTITLQKEFFAWPRHSQEDSAADFLLLPPATLTTEKAQQIRQEALTPLIEEDRRLLYVAMTRAQDGLCSIGWPKETSSWHTMISTAVAQYSPNGLIGQYEKREATPPKDACLETQSYEILRPDRPFVTHGFCPPQTVHEEAIFGILIHSFITAMTLEHFDAVTAQVWFRLEAEKLGLSQEFLSSFDLEALLKIAQKPEFYFISKAVHEAVFFQDSKIFRLDHFYIDESKAVIIEVKTSPNPPKNSKEILESYQEQIRNYYAIVKANFPNREIISYFLWTATQEFMLFETSTSPLLL